MIIKRTKNRSYGLNDPLKLNCHARPKTRRDFIAQGFMSGGAVAFGSGLWLPNSAFALSSDLTDLACSNIAAGSNKIPFICIDLAGGANIAGSNVLVGGRGPSGGGDQRVDLSTAGYSKLGLPGDMVPSATNPDVDRTDFVDDTLGLRFHSDSPFLRGILERTSSATQANINGAVIPARSENDTGNNPHNPTYGIYRAGATGELLNLIGSRSSMSGGNSLSPMDLIDTSVAPTKVDRPSDAVGLVDIGDLSTLFGSGAQAEADAVSVMESIYRISDSKLNNVQTTLAEDADIKEQIRCNYVKSAHLAEQYGGDNPLDPEADSDIVGDSGIFSQAEFDGDNEFRKAASIMKLVLDGPRDPGDPSRVISSYSAAGTITLGGYDYHTGERATGERRDLRAGRIMGACLEYAARLNRPLMLYVFSDGSVASNGRLDMSEDGGGKGEWTGDNQSTAASFYLVFNPAGRPLSTNTESGEELKGAQIGWMRIDASVDTASSPAANNVNLLVQTVIANYMALHGEQGNFGFSHFTNQSIFDTSQPSSLDSLIGLQPIVNGNASTPV